MFAVGHMDWWFGAGRMDCLGRNRLGCRSPRIAVRSVVLAVIVMICVRLLSTKRHFKVIRVVGKAMGKYLTAMLAPRLLLNP